MVKWSHLGFVTVQAIIMAGVGDVLALEDRLRPKEDSRGLVFYKDSLVSAVPVLDEVITSHQALQHTTTQVPFLNQRLSLQRGPLVLRKPLCRHKPTQKESKCQPAGCEEYPGIVKMTDYKNIVGFIRFFGIGFCIPVFVYKQ